MKPAAAAIRIRPLERHDVSAFRDALASGAVAATTRRRFPPSLTSMHAWFDALSADRDRHQFAIVAGQRFIGTCSLRAPIFSGRELTIAIFDPRYFNRGIGTLAVRAMCDFGFEKLRLARIELGVYPSNHRAIACYTRCGFLYEALLRRFLYHQGAWVDVMLMAVWRSQYRDAKSESAARSEARPPIEPG